MKLKFFYIILIVFLALSFPHKLKAQADPPPDPVDTPIDGGLSLLLAAGIAYGAKKGYDNMKNKKTKKVELLK